MVPETTSTAETNTVNDYEKVKDLVYLVFVHVVLQLCLAQLIECDNDEGHEDVDKEEWENHKEDDVEDGHFNPEPGLGTLALVRRSHGVLQDSERKDKNRLFSA